jgi:hypothetical protein
MIGARATMKKKTKQENIGVETHVAIVRPIRDSMLLQKAGGMASAQSQSK